MVSISDSPSTLLSVESSTTLGTPSKLWLRSSSSRHIVQVENKDIHQMLNLGIALSSISPVFSTSSHLTFLVFPASRGFYVQYAPLPMPHSTCSLFSLGYLVLAQDQRSCYYPDGSLSLKDTPCSSDTNTTCCGQGFACLENGICQVTSLAQAYDPDLNPLINYYRGSCTNQDWSIPKCPQFWLEVNVRNKVP